MKEESSSVMAFDALYTNNSIQKLKVLFPYVAPSMRKNMAIYIKYMELKYTMDLFKKHPFQICAASTDGDNPDIQKIFQELKPYCTEAESKQLEQLSSMLKTMEMYQEMSQTISAMQEMFPHMSTGNAEDGSPSGTSMEDLLMGMLSPEQKAMFDAFSKNI
ncbi:MAG: hypothetical protein NC433_03745 [Clostridiales bacterium]|nr:hypothetical protein [Clostridiales bacterium]